MQYTCIYCFLVERKMIHIQQHDCLSATWQQVRRGLVHRTGRRRTSGCTPALQGTRTSPGMGSSRAAHSQTAAPATACEERCASWSRLGSDWGPWCSLGPFAAFRTWTVFCPGPTEGPLYASGQKRCSDPASSSSLWRWRPFVAWLPSQISPAGWSRIRKTRIQSRCSWVDEISLCDASCTSSIQIPINKLSVVPSLDFRAPQRSP